VTDSHQPRAATNILIRTLSGVILGSAGFVVLLQWVGHKGSREGPDGRKPDREGRGSEAAAAATHRETVDRRGAAAQAEEGCST
jgi:hypothetical protein